MTPLIQVCVVIVTMAVVVISFMTFRLLVRLDALSKSLEEGVKAFEGVIESSKRATSQLPELIRTTQQIAGSVRGIVARAEGVADHATQVADELIDEVERPIHRAASVMRGIRAGASFLMQRWAHRHSNGVHTNDYKAIPEGGPRHA